MGLQASKNTAYSTNQSNNRESTSSFQLKNALVRPFMSLNGTAAKRSSKHLGVKGEKIGHREVKDGVVLYKKVPTAELKNSIQLGIENSIQYGCKLMRTDDRNLIIQDFQTIETIMFRKLVVFS